MRRCLHAYVEPGDWVPYGSTTVQLPDWVECGNMNLTDEQLEEIEYLTCDDCPYYEEGEN